MAPARFIKRTFDLMGALVLAIVLAPLLLVVAALIALDDGLPILYWQERSGRGGRVFRLVKFRSMRVHSLPPSDVGQVHEHHPLVTRVGRSIRRFKIDELPQLVNVIRGELSLVGPRPALPEQVSDHSDFQRRRLEMRPGLTGWAQVNGNTALDWEDRLVLDVWYVDHWSLGLDLRILFSTIKVIGQGERPDEAALAEAWRHARRTDRSG